MSQASGHFAPHQQQGQQLQPYPAGADGGAAGTGNVLMGAGAFPAPPAQYERLMAARIMASVLTSDDKTDTQANSEMMVSLSHTRPWCATRPVCDSDVPSCLFLLRRLLQTRPSAFALLLPQVTLRALTERDEVSNHLVTTVPVELLSEWAHTALEARDCGALGRAMTIAAACGHELGAL